ncbi:hypothetical protein TSEDIMI_90001 [Tenacibaculum sediminilitoris]
MKWNGSQTACEAFSYGEVEDYTVNITGASSSSFNTTFANVETNPLRDENVIDLMAYPNPALDFIQVKFASKADNMTYKVVNTIGRVMKSGRLDTSSIDVSKLNTGIYILEVNDGQKLLTTKVFKK